jgi:DNA-binding NarL/FixJ family response regulator
MCERRGSLKIVPMMATGTEDYPNTMNTKPVLALIVVAPGPLQDGLLALMTTYDPISAVFVAEEASLALRIVKDHRPNLILLDINLPKAQMVLEQTKSRWPQTHCIALASDVEQERAIKGADAVLIEGFSPSHLLATIEDLLAQSENR